MNNIIQNLDEITDSRELLEAKPHRFTSTFAYGLIAILVIALIWAYFGEIDIVVKTNGIVKSNDKTISVLNEVDGKVSDVSFKEGQKVKKGDILYTLESKDAILSKNNYDKQLKTLQLEIANMDKLTTSILENKNSFDSNNPEEKDYYDKYLQYTTTNEKLLLAQKQATTSYKSQVDNAQIPYNTSVLKLQQYKDQYISQIATSISQANSTLNDIKDTFTTTSFQISQIQSTINNLQLLVQSINAGKNLFTDSSSTYYRQYVDYTNNLQKYQASPTDAEAYKNSYLITVTQSTDTQKNSLAQLQSTASATDIKTSNINQTIYNLQLLQSSINKNQNSFVQSNTEYYNKYIDYQNNISQLQNDVTSQAKLISSLATQKDGTTDDYNSQLATKDITKYKMDTLVQLAAGIKQNDQKLDELKANIENLQLNIDKSTVKAPIDGAVSVKYDISINQLVKSGQEVLTVIPQNNSQYRVQLYVSNKDIVGMKIGEKVKYHFHALPYKEYGELTGTITDIAVDSTVDQQSGTSYYLIESAIQNKPLFSYKGEKGELKIGMTCEAQAITKRKKILYFLLEKINLKN